jgi:hydroxymethylbilane synthase
VERPAKIILGTRGSALAVAQSRLFADSLQGLYPDLKIEIQKIVTSGDQIQDRFLKEVGGKGLFVKEIEEALLAGEIDLAVHSLKDMPAVLPEALQLACFPQRLDPQDVLITREGLQLSELKSGSLIGTTSLRRRIQIQKIRSDLRFEILRGNIDTRLKRLQKGDFDAIILAKAGLKRLGADLRHAVELSIVPAPGQGTLAIEIRKNDTWLRDLLKPLHHGVTEIVSKAERHVMKALGGSCNLPLGVFGAINHKSFTLKVFLSSPDGGKYLEESLTGDLSEAQSLAEQILEKLWQRGAKDIVESIKQII